MWRNVMSLQQLRHLGFGLPYTLSLGRDRGGTDHEPVRAMGGRSVV